MWTYALRPWGVIVGYLAIAGGPLAWWETWDAPWMALGGLSWCHRCGWHQGTSSCTAVGQHGKSMYASKFFFFTKEDTLLLEEARQHAPCCNGCSPQWCLSFTSIFCKYTSPTCPRCCSSLKELSSNVETLGLCDKQQINARWRINCHQTNPPHCWSPLKMVSQCFPLLKKLC